MNRSYNEKMSEQLLDKRINIESDIHVLRHTIENCRRWGKDHAENVRYYEEVLVDDPADESAAEYLAEHADCMRLYKEIIQESESEIERLQAELAVLESPAPETLAKYAEWQAAIGREVDSESDEADDVAESNVELDSGDFVTWDCFDTLPFLIKHGGIRVNLTNRPAFYADEGMYRAVADGDDDSFMVEWTGTAERCDWRKPVRIVTLDEFNAEYAGNAQCHVPAVPEIATVILDDDPEIPLVDFDAFVPEFCEEADYVPDEWIEEMFPGNVSPVAALAAESVEKPAETETSLRGATSAAKRAKNPVDLLGNPVSAPIVPSRQLSLFEKAEFTRSSRHFPAVVLRENGEQTFGKIDSRTPKKELTFTSHKTGKQFTIPLRYCNITWAGNAAIIDIAERDLGRNVKLYGMFASCCLF